MTKKVEKRMFKKKKIYARRYIVTCGPLSSDSELYVLYICVYTQRTFDLPLVRPI